MTDDKNILHANAFHMKTIKEPLKEVIKRNKNKIINIFNINNKL